MNRIDMYCMRREGEGPLLLQFVRNVRNVRS